ncbi:hypothetical protein KAR91_83325 [Candidatus Pacearchaeota archaeon]|nr:hypothetical protein [Candidatus Pacearchaeota archaeon]
MNIRKLEEAMNEAQLKASRIKRLLDARAAIESTIANIRHLKTNAGAKIFTGRSGKIGEDNLLCEVRINDVGGCVAVPDLLLELAEKKLADLDKEAETFSA